MKRLVAGLVAAAVLCGTSPLRADKPEKSKGKSKGQGQDAAVVVTFTVDQRHGAQAYFVEKHGRGGCPPGLAKKNNGCLPPGQAKKLWAIGQPLPGTVVFYPLPGPLLLQLTPAPTGYQYVRVANDILLMAVGTRMITAAIADLSAM